jgi:3-phosphoglycerate kinase
MDLRLITEVESLSGVTVIVRASCNVPLVDGVVRNAFRLKRALPTLKYLREHGARTIIISHIGREKDETLKPVFDELSSYLPMTWGGKITDQAFDSIKEGMDNGDIVFCENLRQDEREEGNSKELVDIIAAYGDIYVNDAFAEAHREHASTFGLAEVMPAYAGITLAEEVSELQKVMEPNHPSLFLLGGAKFETKMPLVEKYLGLYDNVFIGGALANDVLKARGLEVGKSLVSGVSLVGSPFLWSEKLLVPIDVIVDGPDGVITKAADAVTTEEKIFDMGPETIALLSRYVATAKTVLWNGPFGNYEAGYIKSTEAVAEQIAASEAFSVLGGGDTVAAVEKLGLNDKFGFVSIGGGSMLTFLEDGRTSVLDKLVK